MALKISERITGTVENWSKSWGDRLRSWMATWLSWGIELFADVIGKAFAPKLKPFIEKIEKVADIPPELRPLLDEMKNPTGEVAAFIASSAGGSLIGGAMGSIMDALFLRFAYSVNAAFHPRILNEAQQISLWLRGLIKGDVLKDNLHKLGCDDSAVLGLMQLAEPRFDPNTVISLYRRDKAKYEKLWFDLSNQGWDAERISAVKELINILPMIQDVIRFAVREVYTPEIAEKFGQFEDFPTLAMPDAEKLGITEELLKKYWAAHWELPSPQFGYEMLHRGIITEDELKLLLRALDVMPYWRDKLIGISWNIPTRVDVRRFWEMGTIDEARLREIYTGLGYHDKDLEDYVLWTKVYVAFPDLVARWKNGWITEDEVRSELATMGMPQERIDIVMETKIKNVQPEQVITERALTKAEIIKGVKLGVITESEGLELIMDMGYSEDTAKFILAINVTAAEGSPESYTDFKKLTQLYRKAVGREANIPSQELLDAEKLLKEAEAALKEAKDKGVKGDKLAPLEKAVSDAQYHYRQLLAKWKGGS